LNPLDFFLWGPLDDRVKISKPKTYNQLKRTIGEEVKKISPECLPKVISEFRSRIDLCISVNGSYFTQLIKKGSRDGV